MNHLQSGLHVKVSRGVYTHHGIYIGDNQVIHYSGFAEAFKKGAIEQTSLESFLGGVDDFKVVNYPSHQNIYSLEEIVHRAQSCLGEDDYNLFFNNCEHFACWCVTGKSRSEQVQEIMRYTTNAVFSYYAFQKYQMLTATSAPITMMTTTPAIGSVLTNMAFGGTVGMGAATVTATVLGTGAATSATIGVLSVTAMGATAIAAAPVVITGAIIGGVFSFFKD
ncbi:MAG: lecithin retinol acyltransferase family protein [Acinetobacter gandensis]|uniref:lecithin retinol acyltransferase family protein n=1 Tax=Acinetobacter gandensis TaxID=1443941 RepID=UPI003D019FBC